MRPTKEQLSALLVAGEDRLLERKLEGVGGAEFRRTMVGFANSTRAGEVAVLLVGVGPDGAIHGVANSDKLQRTLRNIAEKECYPAIVVELETIATDKGVVVAVLVPSSSRRPHFAGGAFIRQGSETLDATDRVYSELLLSQDDRRRYLLDHIDSSWTIDIIGKGVGDNRPPRNPQAYTSFEGRVTEVTAFYVKFKNIGTGTSFTEMLQDVHISYDDAKHRPRAVVFPTGRGQVTT